MHFFKLILRNALRHKLRTALTVLGIVIAVLAFGLLQTVVDAWYAGADKAAPNRLITRNAISLTFPLPLAYREKIRGVEGVKAVSYANWFGGIYQSPKNFFPQFAIDPETYLAVYSEYRVDERELAEFIRDRKGALVGRKLADAYGFRIGDTVPLKGTIYPGTWEFTVRGIYEGADARTDTAQFFFHWDYLNETSKKRSRVRVDQVGVFVVEIDAPERAAAMSQAIDGVFRNSVAETLTETERAFQLSFVAMTGTIVAAIRIVSFVVIFIILAVMANTMAMTARERLSEYATLKALGFGPLFVSALILGESIAIAAIGGAIGMVATFPVAKVVAAKTGTLFPVFEVSSSTLGLQVACALGVGLAAALVPMRRAASVRIVEGLRAVG
ncbi:MAG: ABC transporter permease [Burkholderiales bacterium]